MEESGNAGADMGLESLLWLILAVGIRSDEDVAVLLLLERVGVLPDAGACPNHWAMLRGSISAAGAAATGAYAATSGADASGEATTDEAIDSSVARSAAVMKTAAGRSGTDAGAALL